MRTSETIESSEEKEGRKSKETLGVPTAPRLIGVILIANCLCCPPRVGGRLSKSCQGTLVVAEYDRHQRAGRAAASATLVASKSVAGSSSLRTFFFYFPLFPGDLFIFYSILWLASSWRHVLSFASFGMLYLVA